MTGAADWRLPDAARPDAKRLIGSMPMAVLLIAPDPSIVSTPGRRGNGRGEPDPSRAGATRPPSSRPDPGPLQGFEKK